MPFPTSLHTLHIDSALGGILLAASRAGLAGLWFDAQRHAPDTRAMRGWVASPDHPVLRAAAAQIAGYFAGRRTPFDVPLDLTQGTAFQQTVWRALLAIPRGQTTRYGALAAQIGRPLAARAVGAAVGRNPISIIVPCHRVLGADGSLTGYAGGLERKQRLLALEKYA